MTATLVPHPHGHLTLEFDAADLGTVSAYIGANFPIVDTDLYPTMAEYRFGGCRFVFQNEWDDPCLISDSDEGDRLLRQIHDHVNGLPRPA